MPPTIVLLVEVALDLYLRVKEFGFGWRRGSVRKFLSILVHCLTCVKWRLYLITLSVFTLYHGLANKLMVKNINKKSHLLNYYIANFFVLYSLFFVCLKYSTSFIQSLVYCNFVLICRISF